MKKPNKIYIVGGVGSGKTTLANKLSKKIKTKVYEMDNIAFKDRESYEREPPKTRDNKLKHILRKKTWILEGAYAGSWTKPIFKKADLIIILNINPKTAQRRIITRFLKRKLNKNREGTIKEKLKDMLTLLKYAKMYPKDYFQEHQKLSKRSKKQFVILNNKKEIESFLGSLK